VHSFRQRERERETEERVSIRTVLTSLATLRQQSMQPESPIQLCIASSSTTTKNRCLGFVKTNPDGSVSWQCEV